MKFLLNFLIDVTVWAILLMKLSGFGGITIQNLCKVIPALLWLCIILHLFGIIVVLLFEVLEGDFPKDIKKDVIEFIEKFPDKDSKIKKIYNKITDFGVVVLFALNGFVGCLLLFIFNNFLQGVLKNAIQKAKRIIGVNKLQEKK